ncbi:uridine kinase [Sphingorhabdus sp. SMR4y]|uniref:uridine kinase n=1 Tax=Sphingorhabdus sp. SMR4y TaxID=2584094 RepID=UPI000B5C5F57|nr:uridine kinase [Sphingorhabdus sp. SMR4y]ASK89069.1 uridine kinase [Sphingorhabdus sp. SMR4y]
MTAKVVGISGGSCSGKSTLTQVLFEALGPDQCVILPQDDYFFGLGDAPQGKGGPNFDHPNAVDFDKLCTQLAQLKSGQVIDRPLYDFPTHMPKGETRRTEPRPVILLDGILILQHRPLRDLLDLSIFVECDSETRFARRIARDVRERGRTEQSVQEQFANQVGPMHDLHVEPSKIHADIVINSQQSAMHYEQPLRLILSKLTAQNQ